MVTPTIKERFIIEATVALVNIANRDTYADLAPAEKVEIIKQVSEHLLSSDHLNIL